MKIRYVGSATIRTIMQYRWDKSNGFVCDVPESLAANLLTYPRPDFVLAEPNKEAAEKKIEDSLAGRPRSVTPDEPATPPEVFAPKPPPTRRRARLPRAIGPRNDGQEDVRMSKNAGQHHWPGESDDRATTRIAPTEEGQ